MTVHTLLHMRRTYFESHILPLLTARTCTYTSSLACLADIPTELEHQITSHLSSHDLAAYALVSKVQAKVAREHLYSAPMILQLDEGHRLIMFLRTLFVGPVAPDPATAKPFNFVAFPLEVKELMYENTMLIGGHLDHDIYIERDILPEKKTLAHASQRFVSPTNSNASSPPDCTYATRQSMYQTVAAWSQKIFTVWPTVVI
jgi:hypothetical protein